jgi:cathepsin L
MDNAFKWVMENGGITTEDKYPYTSNKGSTGDCITSGYTNVAEVAPRKVKDVEKNYLRAMKEAVARQPIAVAVQSQSEGFWQYKSGVIDAEACGTRPDHGVLVTGYDKKADPPYWIVKNSWGTSWGDDGYIKIEMGVENACGIMKYGSFPKLVD